MRGRPFRAAALAAALLVLAACGAAAPMPTAPVGAVIVTAEHDTFTTSAVTAPAGAAFTIYFENKDTSQHNVRIWKGATSLTTTEIFSGPGARVLDVAALDPGEYRLTCDIHPAMLATLTAQ